MKRLRIPRYLDGKPLMSRSWAALLIVARIVFWIIVAINCARDIRDAWRGL